MLAIMLIIAAIEKILPKVNQTFLLQRRLLYWRQYKKECNPIFDSINSKNNNNLLIKANKD